jgi:ppGpp synthetase/RelA/SpoT-type nucleotidyltranferase
MNSQSDPVAAFDQLRPKLSTAAHKVQDLITAWLDTEGINYLSVSARAKTGKSFSVKANKCLPDGSPKYTDPLNQITDLIGARVITYIPESVNRVCEIIKTEFNVVEELDKGAEVRARGLFGYASKHFLVRLGPQRCALPEYSVVGDRIFEIQVRTAVQHAWAEFEHDVRYKVDIPSERKAEFDRRFLLAAALIEMADNEFAEIDRLYRGLAQAQGSMQASERPTTMMLLNSNQLTAYLNQRYPEAPRSRAAHYDWMVSVLAACGVTTIEELEDTLAPIDSNMVAAAMEHKLPAGHVRRLEDDLLAALGDAYARASRNGPGGEANRTEIIMSRSQKLQAAGLVPD